MQTHSKHIPLIFDGAMGTYFASKGYDSKNCETANLQMPGVIEAIHREYIEAGAQALKTNTFGANTATLGCSFEQVEQIIRAGVEIAKRAAAGRAAVFGDMSVIPIEDKRRRRAEYFRIVDVFLDCGVDNFLIETLNDAADVEPVSAYIRRRRPSARVIVSFAVAPDGYTRSGVSGAKLLETAGSLATVDAVGFNCVSGPYHLLQYIRKLHLKATGKQMIVMPNAGYPTLINNRTVFENNPVYFAKLMRDIVGEGVLIVGGCCGTTPDYIRETVAALRMADAEMPAAAGCPDAKQAAARSGRAKSPILEKLEAGRRVVAVELDPPFDAQIGFFLDCARQVKACGADAVTIADCPIARARVDSSMLSAKLRRELAVETIPHLTCRDRNINATKALLLGLHIEGVQNVLVVTGDPVPEGNRREIKAVFNFNSVMLAEYIRDLNETVFENPFTVFGALNVNAKNFEAELRRAHKKTAAGVQVFLTQPVFSEQAVRNLKQARQQLDAKILGGIMPVVSYRNACFMNNEIAGITIPEETVERYRDISREEASRLAVEIAADTAKRIYDCTDGYYLMTPLKRIDIITALIRKIQTMEETMDD